MRDGVIVQDASPKEMLKNPVNDYVREFIGEERLSPQPNITPVSDVMVSKPLTVPLDTSPGDVMAKMKKRNSDFAVVVDKSRNFHGIITANEIQLLQRQGSKNLDNVNRQEPISASTTIRDAAHRLANGAAVLGVVNKKNRPIGLVSRVALLRGLVEIWDEASAE